MITLPALTIAPEAYGQNLGQKFGAEDAQAIVARSLQRTQVADGYPTRFHAKTHT